MTCVDRASLTWSSASNMRKIFQKIEHNNYLIRGTPGHGFDGYFQDSMREVTSVSQPSKAVWETMASALGLDPAKII